MKNSILCFYVIILITMLSCTVNAADSTIRTNDRPPKLSDMPKFCREAEGEVGLALCLANKNEEVEGYLRRVEGKIKKDLEPDEKALFQKASSDWLKFVDSTCDYDTNGLGSMKGSVISSCHIRLNIMRINHLEKYEQCLSNDDCERPILLHMIITEDK